MIDLDTNVFRALSKRRPQLVGRLDRLRRSSRLRLAALGESDVDKVGVLRTAIRQRLERVEMTVLGPLRNRSTTKSSLPLFGCVLEAMVDLAPRLLEHGANLNLAARGEWSRPLVLLDPAFDDHVDRRVARRPLTLGNLRRLEHALEVLLVDDALDVGKDRQRFGPRPAREVDNFDDRAIAERGVAFRLERGDQVDDLLERRRDLTIEQADDAKA